PGLRGTPAAEVRLQGARAGDQDGPGHGMAKVGAGLFLVLVAALGAQAPDAPKPVDALPKPHPTNEHHFKLPEGRTWGSTSAVEVDRDGTSIWVGERCGANT